MPPTSQHRHPILNVVIPAQAGIQRLSFKSPQSARKEKSLDPGLRRDDDVES
jgi:hypothetical protein